MIRGTVYKVFLLVMSIHDFTSTLVIGLSGGNPDDPYSGKTTGSHLHFEQRINGESVDPYSSIFYFGMYTVSVEEVQ